MAFVLFPALCLLSGAYAQEWDVTIAPGPLAGWVGSCVTIHCSFSYPAGETVTAVSWTMDSDQTVYRSDNDHIDPAFKGRAQYLGDLKNNCSLRLAGLRPSDSGTYHFQFLTVNYSWENEPGQWLSVSASPCQPRLGSRMDPGPSLTCSMPDTCPHRPSWYDADGAQRSPGQTPAGKKATELPISPSRLPPGVALRCQVDGYWDGCGSDQPQPPGPVAPNVPSVVVFRPGGKTVIKAGNGFTLRCQAGAPGPGAGYVWSRGDVWLRGDGQDFRTDKADVSDGGSYSCGVWVSGPGWAYLSLSARKSVKVQGAYAQTWGVTFAPGPLAGWVGSCVTIHCSFSYPAGQTVTAVSWTLDRDQTVYHSDNDRIDPAFKGRAQYLGDLQNNCSLRLARLRPSDNGTYRFRFVTVRDRWMSEPGQQLIVSASPCQPRLQDRMDPGPSLACFVRVTCPHRLSWYDADGARRSPEQFPVGRKATELPISPSRLPPGVALRCQVDGYWDGCGSDQPQPLEPVAPNVPSVEVLRPGGKTAIKAGDGFTLRCQAGALGPGAGYVWSRGDVWLPGAGQDFRTDKANVSNGGNYSCGVWVSGPGWAYLSLSARESVEVQDAPKGVNITATPGTVLHEGHPVKLRCHFSSRVPAAVTYTWYKDNSRLGLSRPELVLQSVTATDAGEYRCEVHNQVGKARSPPVIIQVTPGVQPHTSTIGAVVAVLLLLLVGLAVLIVWRKRWSKRPGMDSDPPQPGPPETPMSDGIYENTQPYGRGGLAHPAPPGPPRAPAEPRQGSPAGTELVHISSQLRQNGASSQADLDGLHYSAIQLQHASRRVELAGDVTCEYAMIKK